MDADPLHKAEASRRQRRACEDHKWCFSALSTASSEHAIEINVYRRARSEVAAVVRAMRRALMSRRELKVAC